LKDLCLIISTMAKGKEEKLAYEYYVNQKKTAKETAMRVGVTEKTIGEWVKKNAWKKLRDAQVNSAATRLNDIREVISLLTEQRIKIQKQIGEVEATMMETGEKKDLLFDLRKSAVAVSDEISKWNKALESLDRQNRISLTVYIEVMNDIFDNLREYDPKLFAKTMDFQEQHLNTISIKY